MPLFEATSASFTRPADTTAYANGDLVANSTTAGSVVPLSFTIPTNTRMFKLLKVTLKKSGTAVTNATFVLHLFRDSPTVANGDNGAISVANSANYAGKIAIDASSTSPTVTGGSTGFSLSSSTNPVAADIDGILYGLLEATAAYTPASAEVFTVSIIGEL
jgi:hypothetical protein